MEGWVDQADPEAPEDLADLDTGPADADREDLARLLHHQEDVLDLLRRQEDSYALQAVSAVVDSSLQSLPQHAVL